MAITTYGQALALAQGTLDHLASSASAQGTDTLTAWVPSWVDAARGELTRMADEDAAAEATAPASRGVLQEQLRAFVGKVQAVWASYGTGAEPAWLRPQMAMKDADFYAAFFAGIAALDGAVQTEIDRAPTGGTRAAATVAYETWQVAGRAAADAGWQRIQRALDIRGCAQGALRLFGLSHADIYGA